MCLVWMMDLDHFSVGGFDLQLIGVSWNSKNLVVVLGLAALKFNLSVLHESIYVLVVGVVFLNCVERCDCCIEVFGFHVALCFREMTV